MPASLRLDRALPLALPVILAACSAADEPLASFDAARISAHSKASATVQQVATTDRPVLTTIGDVTVYRSGHGSAIAFAPGDEGNSFYLLTDRGPNVDGPTSDIKIFAAPSYTPTIYRARVSGPHLRIEDAIPLRRPDGAPLTGLPIPVGQCGSTLETAKAVDGTTLTPDPFGIDSEGLAVDREGTFWVSDEYGPFIARYDRSGRELQRLSPCNGGIPEVYKLRRPNRGMEGLSITPDGEWLVTIMQAPLENPSRTGVRNISRATRILLRHIATGRTREYLYLLESPTLQGNSEILALSATRFLVLERDGNFLFGSPAAAVKRIYEADVATATDISALGALGAKPIGGTKTIEQATVAELDAAGIRSAVKSLRVDLVALGYPHDKPEGIALAPTGKLFIVNDDDFAVTDGGGTVVQKLLPPTGRPDYVSVWVVKSMD